MPYRPTSGPLDEHDLREIKEEKRRFRLAEEDDDRTIHAANRAKQFLEDEFIQQIFEEMEVELLMQFRRSQIGSPEVREEAHRLLMLIDQFKQRLHHSIESGMLASKRKETRAQERAVKAMEKTDS